ncbi:MAG: TonB-dependent receptor [Bacteroidetes bacterium]|nr:TonB-dependent receptor [Bacteroidota bacterium]
MKNRPFLISLLCLMADIAFAQEPPLVDSTHIKYLAEITLVGRANRSDLQQIPEIVGTAIYAGKKSSLLVMKNVEGNITTNVMRQVMAKIPGIHIWENDGSGIQIGIATRGLSPNRSWEFNVRQNGYDISADPYGYPEAYYNPQLQAVQRIEIIRGHGALQYGPQFGGMVNYILRDGSEFKKSLQLETQQTVGSSGLSNLYAGAGGKTGKWNYFAFFDRRQADGYRVNSQYYTNAGFITVTYRPTKKISTTLEYMRSHIRSQQPGGLSDLQIQQDNRQSLRHRNWMDIEWSTLAWRSRLELSASSRMELKLFGLLGDRNSVGFLPAAGIIQPDSILRATGNFAPRNVNIDHYSNWGGEWRWIFDYKINKSTVTLSTGLRRFVGRTNRLAADGKGDVGSAYTLQVQNDTWIRDIDFSSANYAWFAEQIVRLGDRLLIIPGFRYEWVSGAASGQHNLQNGVPVNLIRQEKTRGFFLGGVGIEYHLNKAVEFYTNITEAYRPVLFSDLSTPPGNDRIDPALKDARGYNADLGIRGKLTKRLYVDVSVYLLHYGNRIGTLLQEEASGTRYNLRTNIGSSNAKGLELFGEYQGRLGKSVNTPWRWSQYLSYSYTDARYAQFQLTRVVNNQVVKTDLKNNQVENAPRHTLRTGATLQHKSIKLTGQFSYTSGTYSDANNTKQATLNAQNGWIPAYSVIDLTLSFPIDKNWSLSMGVNNLTDAVYFTRRAGGYPGPGAMPADGRTIFATLRGQL